MKYIKLFTLILLLINLSGCTETRLIAHSAKQIIKNDQTSEEEATPLANQSTGIYKIGSPYQINGIWYTPKDEPGYIETGIASWYGPKFNQKITANGEIFDQDLISGAHKTLPLPSLVKVTNLENGKTLNIRINDRGPFVGDRIIDLSKKAAEILEFKDKGVTSARVELLESGPHLLNYSSNEVINKSSVKVENITTQNINFIIQLGAFSDPANADKLAYKLRQEFKERFVTHVSRKDGKTLYRVRTDLITNSKNADELVIKLQDNGYIVYLISEGV